MDHVLTPRLISPVGLWHPPLGDLKCRTAISLSVIRIAVTPVPVIGLVPGVQLNESPLFVVLGLIPLVRAAFVGVPVVIVLMDTVVVFVG
jgi:hypothetical protein